MALLLSIVESNLWLLHTLFGFCVALFVVWLWLFLHEELLRSTTVIRLRSVWSDFISNPAELAKYRLLILFIILMLVLHLLNYFHHHLIELLIDFLIHRSFLLLLEKWGYNSFRIAVSILHCVGSFVVILVMSLENGIPHAWAMFCTVKWTVFIDWALVSIICVSSTSTIYPIMLKAIGFKVWIDFPKHP